jgi:diguanylate cyclase (GGDEF)-like protein
MTVYYVSALLIIAGLSIASHALLYYSLGHAEGRAAVINETGRQRMFSQRIAGLAAQIRLGDEGARQDLALAITAFETAHDELIAASRDPELGDSGDHRLRAIYFDGTSGLDAQVRGFVADARRVLEMRAGDPAMAVVSSRLFAAARSPLLSALDDVVTLHQKESERSLALLMRLQWAILGIVLITLFVEAVAIFRPMIRRIVIYTSELLKLATTDSLTGASNRRHFMEVSQGEFARAKRYGRPLCFLMLDVDHFKAVNDIHGHAAGDAVLRAICENIKGTMRHSDILGRLGGEEFAILLIETPLPGALEFAERLRRKIEAMAIRHGDEENDIRVTVSMGLAAVLKDTESLDSALNLADSLMYRAKQSGRNRIVSEAVAEPSA